MPDSLQTRDTLLGRLVDIYDEESWHEFVQYYRKFIYLLIIRLNVNHHDAEELTQEILLKLWKKLPDFKYNQEKGRFRSWLCRITDNQVKNFFRSKSRKKENFSSDDFQATNISTLPEINKLAEEEWEKYITVMAWENIKVHFSDSVCEAFLMLRRGHSRSEVAQKLGLAETSVSTYKTRIIERMKSEISRLDNELNGL